MSSISGESASNPPVRMKSLPPRWSRPSTKDSHGPLVAALHRRSIRSRSPSVSSISSIGLDSTRHAGHGKWRGLRYRTDSLYPHLKPDLNLQHNRDDHRPAPGLSLNIPFEVESDFLLDDGPVHALFVAGVAHRFADHYSGPVQEIGAVVAQGQPALNDFRGGFHLARRLIDGDDGQNDPVVSQVLPIAQHQFVDPARARVIDQGAPHRGFVGDLRAVFVKLDDVAALGEHDAVPGDAPLARGLGVAIELAGLAVDRDQEFRSHGVIHNLQVAFAPVP